MNETPGTPDAPPNLRADPQVVRGWMAQHYFSGAPGMAALCSTRNWTGIQTSNLDEAVQWVLREDAAGALGIYARVTTVNRVFPDGSRGSARDSHALLDMWSDLDFGDDGHKTTGLPKDAAEAADIPTFAGLPAATETHHSGGGLYKRWTLDRPVIIGEDIEYDDVVQLAAGWQNILLIGAKRMHVGYGTGVKDLARVLRLPGTVNRKPGRTPVLCEVIETGGPRYTLAELQDIVSRLRPEPPAKKTPPPASAPTATGARKAASKFAGPGPLEILGDHACAAEILEFVGCTYREQYPGNCSYCGSNCQRWLRPGWAEGNSIDGVAVHKGGAAVTIRTDNFPGLPGGFLNRVLSPGQLFAALHHGGDESAAAGDIRRASDGHPDASAAALALPTDVLTAIRSTRPDPRPTKGPSRLRSVPPVTETITDGTAALKVDDEDVEHQEEGEAPQAAKSFDYSKVFGLPGDTRTPTGYQVKGSGVWLRRTVGKEEQLVRFAFAPLVVTATFEDPDGNQYIELSWVDRTLTIPRKISKIVSRETAKRGKKLIERLGAAGLPAVEGDARLLERWLAEFETENVRKIPSEKLARWLGWQDDGSFVSSPDDGTKVDVEYEEMRGPAAAHGRKGTLAEWQNTVKTLAAFPVPRVVIAAALAAPLLRHLGINSFTVDVSSRSTKGKTTALQCGCSVWADPSEHAAAMSNWRTTLYAIEKRLNLVRGIVTVFDETMAVTDDSLIDEVLYQLPMNHGKARSGGAFGSMLPWETILLSSGERPALSFTTSQGAAARILGTTAPPFGSNGGDAAVKARDGVLANFGHAGPEFVRYVIECLAKPRGLEALREKHRFLTEEFKGTSDMTNRRAPMVAALALAESLACGMDLLPYEALPADVWRGLFAGHNPTDNRPEMAMDVVREYVASHEHELFAGVSMDDRTPYAGWLGVRKGTGTDTRIAILPERLRKILEQAGYVLDSVIGGWLDAGYLDLRDNQRPKHLIPYRFAGSRAKCLVFLPTAFPSDDQEAA